MFRNRNPYIKGLIIGLGIAIVGFSVCYFIFIFAVRSRQRYPDYDIALFISPNCEPPCWHGLIPGTTKQAEVDAFLYSNPLVDINSIWKRGNSYGEYDDEYSFQINPAPISVAVYFYEGRVSNIYLYEDTASNDFPSIGFNVGELIEEYGEPQFLLKVEVLGPGFLMADALHEIIYFLYPEEGIAFSINQSLLPENQRNQVNEDNEVSELIYFFPDDYVLLLESNRFRTGSRSIEEIIGLMLLWSGYGEYRFGKQ